MRQIKLILIIILMLPSVSFSQLLGSIDEIAPFSEGLAAVRNGELWGFINEEGALVIDYRNDLYWNEDADISRSDIAGIRYPIFNEGRCLISKIVEDGVPVYGFIDTKGNVIIEPQFLNIYPFKNGYTTGVLYEKYLKGENEFKLKIFEFKFHDVLVSSSGKIEAYFEKRENIQMTKKRYQLPWIGARKLTANIVAVRMKDQGWEIRKLSF